MEKSCTTKQTAEEGTVGAEPGDWEWKPRKQSVFKGKKSHLLHESDSPLSSCSQMNNIPAAANAQQRLLGAGILMRFWSSWRLVLNSNTSLTLRKQLAEANGEV